ncbi:retropepsin-like aspartic protease [Chitinophaga rhizophila]|uniref:Retropepsin-like domain-containing protein n=1 Tax=Chitinophaga rhizophila TaxID=2866212 RepID=A0ABS7GEG8_9BACT|nr:retropepsin-like aspartic protease [Chitinophaga rhizophila]MBW8686067.1 retropepsin-like domain-containing protein [Chitinophaga rhizophila]
MFIVRKYLFAILVCLPVFVFAQEPANQKPTATVPFRLFDRYMVISCALSGITPSGVPDSLHFIFDTGAEVTTLRQQTADRLQLKTKNIGGLSGTDAVVVRVPTAELSVLYFEKTRLPFVKVYIEPLNEFQDIPVTIDGIIGVDLLKAFVVRIDYEKEVLLLYRSNKTPPGTPGQRLPLSLNFNTPVVNGVINLPDGQSIDSRFHLISGGEYGILFNYPFVEKHRLNSRLTTLSTDKVRDLYKELTYTNTSLPAMELGAVKLTQVAASYCKDVNDAGSIYEMAGSIGYMVWRQFRTITINYSGRELFLDK